MSFEEQYQYMRNRCRKDFTFLVQKVLVPFEFGEDFKLGKFHLDRLAEVGDSIVSGAPRTLDLWFRGGFKTTFVSRHSTLFRLLRDPNLTILIRHGDADKAQGVVKGVKLHLAQNERFRLLFPEYCPAKGKQFGTQAFFDLPNKTLTAPEHSVTGVGIDANVTGGHWRHIHDDDIENMTNMNTPETRFKLIRSWQDTPSLLTKKPVYVGTHSNVGTIWHAEGLWTHVIRKFGPESDCPPERKFVLRFYPAAVGKMVNGRFVPDRDEKGSLIPMAPEVLDLEDLERVAYEEGPYKFSANYLLCPVDEENAVFRSEWITYRSFPGSVEKYDKWWLGDCRVRRVLTVDLAESEKRGSDMIGYLIVDIDDLGRWYIREAFEGRVDTLKFIRRVQDLHKKWDFDKIYVEATATQNYFSKWLRRENELDGVSMPLHPVKRVAGNQAKYHRILGCQARWARGDVTILEDARNRQTLVTNMVNYPASDHDDLLDAMAQLETMEGKGRRREDPEKDKFGTAEFWMDLQDQQMGKRRVMQMGDLGRPQKLSPGIIALRRRRYG